MLLNYKCKFLGIFLVVSGIILHIFITFFDFRLEFLTVKVLAVFSWFTKPVFFKIINNNITNEIAILSFLIGFIIIIFSKEKKETKYIKIIRYKAIFHAFIFQLCVYIFATLFVYGIAYIAIISMIMPIIFIVYLGSFYIQKHRKKN